MRFLIDANMPRGAVVHVNSRGHDAVDVRDIGMKAASDEEIAAHARTNELAILTRDFDFGDVRN